MNFSKDVEPAVSIVSAYCWETMAISERTVWKESIDIGTASGLKCGLCKGFRGL